MSAARVIALAGNPNTGKTSVFNRLTGASARVGTYPGITVEVESGRLKLPSGEVEVLDIPGAYSLSSRSAEEQVAERAIFGRGGARPALVVTVVDSTQLLRNLYFVTQLLEAGVPMVVGLNLIDVARAKGIEPDVKKVREALGVPVVAISARTGEGFEELIRQIDQGLADPASCARALDFPYPRTLEADLQRLSAQENAASPQEARAMALWSLLSVADEDELVGVSKTLRAEVAAVRAAAQQAGRDLDMEIIGTRWTWLDALDLVPKPKAPPPSRTAAIDRWVLHPVAGVLIFILVMGTMFQALFAWSQPAIHAIQGLFDALGGALRSALPAGVVADFLCDGVIGGVGSVLVFLPQILLLFLLIGFLEDSGYMSRVAFLVDRVMRSIGLHGRAFVPMLSGYACAVPAVMATRTLERRRDRLVTMLALPLMTCSARLPVYTLVIAAMFPPEGRLWGWVPMQTAAMVGIYLFSTTMALTAAAVIGRTALKGPNVPLLLELPPYRAPRFAVVARQMWLRARSFLTEAGRVILACAVVLWALLYFPRDVALSKDYAALKQGAAAEQVQALEAEEAGERLRLSYGGRIGRALEPAIAPLGFDWKIGVGLVGAFAAREVFISTLGVVYGLGAGASEESVPLNERIRAEKRPDGRSLYSPLVGVSLMIFFALCMQCMSTLAMVRRESRSLKWPAFLFAYMTTLAWLASFAVYQVGTRLGLG